MNYNDDEHDDKNSDDGGEEVELMESHADMDGVNGEVFSLNPTPSHMSFVLSDFLNWPVLLWLPSHSYSHFYPLDEPKFKINDSKSIRIS